MKGWDASEARMTNRVPASPANITATVDCLAGKAM